MKPTVVKKILDALWYIANAVPLRFKIMGMVIGTALAIALFTTLQVKRVMMQETMRQLQDVSCSVARELASRAPDYILVNDLFGVTRMMRSAVKNRRDLRYAFIVSSKNEVIAHTFHGGFPEDLLNVRNYPMNKSNGSPLMLNTNEGVVWDCAAPILEGTLGVVRVGVSTKRAMHVIHALLNSMLMTVTAVAIFGLFFSAFLTWLLTRPINALLHATRAVRQGDYSIRVKGSSKDEIGELVEAFNDMLNRLGEVERLRKERESLRQEYLRRTILAQEEERQRIARELHDQLGQTLASLRLDLTLIESASSKDIMLERIDRLRNTITQELDAIHDLVLYLRPSVLDDMGLVPAIERYISDYVSRSGIKVDFVPIGLDKRRLDPLTETSVYRIIQEALTNIVRHSKAKKVTIILEARDQEIRAVVEDDGIGFDKKAINRKSMGLYGMKERARLLRGRLNIRSSPGHGTMIDFVIPVSGDTGVRDDAK